MCKYIINISPSLYPFPMWPTYLPPSNYRVNNLIIKSVILVGMSNRAILQSIAVTYLPHKFQYNMVLLLISPPHPSTEYCLCKQQVSIVVAHLCCKYISHNIVNSLT